MDGNLKTGLITLAGIGAITLLAESCPEKDKPHVDPVDRADDDEVTEKGERIKEVVGILIGLGMQKEEPEAQAMNPVEAIRECVEDSGEYFCFGNPFSSTRCYNMTGTLPIKISNPGITFNEDGDLVDGAITISVGPNQYSETFDTKKETGDACDYAVDLLDQNLGLSDLDVASYSDKASAYWFNAFTLMPSIGIANDHLFLELNEKFDITDMGGQVFNVNFGNWDTMIYTDIMQDHSLGEDIFSIRFNVRKPSGIYKAFDDPHLVVKYLEGSEGLDVDGLQE